MSYQLNFLIIASFLFLSGPGASASEKQSSEEYEIVFGSFRNGDFASSLFVVSVDGKNERQICMHNSGRPTCLDPTVSPDYSKILFSRGGSNHRTSIWLLDTKLGKESQLTDDVNIRFDGGRAAPRLSSDGQHFLFSSNLSGGDDIFVGKTGTRKTQKITDGMGNNTYAAWSPDGELIVFVSDRSGTSRIYVMSKDGKHPRAVSSEDLPATYPSWSPDGKKLIFSGSTDGKQFDLYVLTVESGSVSKIPSRSDLSERHASWSPDGRLIVFASKTKDSQRGFDRTIFVMNADGSSVRRVTSSKHHDFSPSWRATDAHPSR
jgi:TolB protein